ncbi:MAG TPA: 3-isopropylmalate dehydratase small subunit [Methanomassiliicoccales archaeon]|nr:3-isopropylmalate dehydratase small subunit [Methanomassiliicoccales archaeon]
MIRGRAWKFGDHVNTDLIIPGRYLDDYHIPNLAKHVMEDVDPDFAKKVQKGDVIVAGRNFGCGSSREQAPAALRAAGVAAIVAASFARIFYRNAINVGLPVVICAEAMDVVTEGEIIEIDLEKGVLRTSRGKELKFKPLPSFLREILDEGGLVPYARKKLGAE